MADIPDGIPETKLPPLEDGDPGPIGAMGAPDLPLYCSKCQRRLVPRRKHLGYDESTGVERTKLELVCPMVTVPFSWLFGAFHDVWAWEPIPSFLRDREHGGDAPGGYRKYGFWSKGQWY